MNNSAGNIKTRELQVLGLQPRASWEEIQRRYRRLALKLHPDRNHERDASQRFQRVVAAYEHLAALRRSERTRSAGELFRLYDDPRVRRLPVNELAVRLRHSSSAEVRAAAACLLGSVGGRESRRLLLEALRDTDATVRRLALEALGAAGGPLDLLRCLPRVGPGLAGVYLGAVARAGSRSLGRLLNGASALVALIRPLRR